MQLDSQRIAIRERSYVDILDLALRVSRAYALPLAAWLAAGVLPAMALNAWLLAGMEADPAGDFPAHYLAIMFMLVLWEIPLATAPATLYLGQAVFQQRPRAGAILGSLGKSLPQLLLYQVIVRGVLLLPLVTWFFPFAAWPHLNEVILLERNPLRAGRRKRMTTYRRMRIVHGGYGGDLFVRWAGTAAAGGLLFLSLWLSLWATAGMLLDEWQWQSAMIAVYYPLALWIVVGYLTVVRFLAYLDLRIRREGWEVELLMRAEAARLVRQLT
jgi:hypothetical protein